MKIGMDAVAERISPHWSVGNKPYVKKTPKQFENDFEFFHLDIPLFRNGVKTFVHSQNKNIFILI